MGFTPKTINTLAGTIHQVALIEAADIPEGIDDKEQRLSEVLKATPLDVRTKINEARVSIPSFADEFVASNSGDTSVITRPYSTNIIRVTAALVMTPTTATAVALTLGNRVLQLPAGYVSLSPISFLLNPQDVRKLTVTDTSGNSFWFWIMGEQLPEVNY